jgi:DNA-binding response OmpR family regulator
MNKKVYKLLIVEDDPSISSLLGEYLADEGFNVVVAHDGEQGLEMAASERPHLILLDVMMPKKDGLTVLKELRMTKTGKDIPVIMLTNQQSIEEVNQALASGVHDYFIKANWDTQALLKSIYKHLS